MDLLIGNLGGAGDIRADDPVAVRALFREAGGDRLEPEQARSLVARLCAGPTSWVPSLAAERALRINSSFAVAHYRWWPRS